MYIVLASVCFAHICSMFSIYVGNFYRNGTKRKRTPNSKASRYSSEYIPIQPDQVDAEEPYYNDMGAGAAGDDDDDDDMPVSGFPLMDDNVFEIDQWDDDIAASQGNDGAVTVANEFIPVNLDDEIANISKSYEDMCRTHIESYMRDAERFLTSNALTKRVLEWQTKLTPVLEEEEKHPSFDIHNYGRTLIHTIQTAPEEIKTEQNGNKKSML